MTAAGPYASVEALLGEAERAFDTMTRADWLEAFAGHARIGDRETAGDRGRAEQAGTATATITELETLRARNADYEARFGHVFLICAAGRTAGEMLAALEARIDNDAGTELANAAREQRKITRLRLTDLA